MKTKLEDVDLSALLKSMTQTILDDAHMEVVEARPGADAKDEPRSDSEARDTARAHRR